MEQEKNKVPSQENENPGLEKFQRAQELYERYFISNEEADFEEMITVLDSIYKNRVKSELREKGCCDKENYEDAMQEASQGIWTRIKKQRSSHHILDSEIFERRYSRRIQNRSRRLHYQTIQYGRIGIPYRSHFTSCKR